MRLYTSILFFVSILIIGCNVSSDKQKELQDKANQNSPPPLPEHYRITVSWLDSSPVSLKIDRSLSYKDHEIKCDSVLAIDYIGFEGEHTYLPVNDKGQWISTIRKVSKLQSAQEQRFREIIGNKNTYISPSIIPCYEPRLSLAYFREGKLIGQTAICLSCFRLESTIKTGDTKEDGLISQKAKEQLSELCKELGFSDCNE